MLTSLDFECQIGGCYASQFSTIHSVKADEQSCKACASIHYACKIQEHSAAKQTRISLGSRLSDTSSVSKREARARSPSANNRPFKVRILRTHGRCSALASHSATAAPTCTSGASPGVAHVVSTMRVITNYARMGPHEPTRAVSILFTLPSLP